MKTKYPDYRAWQVIERGSMARDIKEGTTVYVDGKHGRRKAKVVKAMPARQAIQKGLFETSGERKHGTFLQLKLEENGEIIGRHKSKVHLTDKPTKRTTKKG